MKKLILPLLLLTGCQHGWHQGPPGPQGPAGPTTSIRGPEGLPGYSVVTEARPATAVECSTGGTVVDLYTDLDRSLDYSLGDTLQNSLVACNGLIGPPGSGSGANTGSVVTTPNVTNNYITVNCTIIIGTKHWAKRRHSSSTDVEIYSSLEACNAGDYLTRLNNLSADVYYIKANKFIVVDGFRIKVMTW